MSNRVSQEDLERFSPIHAELFLKTLDKKEDFHFRVFNEDAKTKINPMKLYGSLEENKLKLQKSNQKGSGVFVVINEGGQKSNEIRRVRAVFADTDGAPLEPLLALEPHMVVESSQNRWHTYWLVDNAFPLEKFKPVQQAIADKFGTDRAVSDLSRVMRLPGFYHNKADPFLTKIVQYSKNLPRYRIEDIVKTLGLSLYSPDSEDGLYKPVKQTSKPATNLQLPLALSISKTPETPAEIVKLKSALKFLSPDVGRGNGKFYDLYSRPEADNWLAIIWAIRSLNWECGKEIAIEWSKQASERYVESEFNEDWNNYNPHHPNPVGMGSLYMRVKELGWMHNNPERSINPLRYALLSRSDIVSQEPYAWRIKNLLPQYGIAAMYGPSGSGKSFLALDAAIAIAEGRPWFGKKTYKTNVLYVALEGEAGYKNRISAWEKQNVREIPSNFYFILQALNLYSKQDVDSLIAVAPEKPVIIIDTLNRASPMADENSSKDMGEILSAAKQIQSATNGLVIIIHHTGKDASKGLRGHSSLFAALDTAIEITYSNKQRSWKIAKSKDGESGIEFHFSLNPVYLGLDSDDEPISSCSIGICAANNAVLKSPTGKRQKVAFNAIKQVLALTRDNRISVDEATKIISEKLIAIPLNKRNNSARNLIQGLLDSGFLRSNAENDEEWIWAE